MKILIHRGNKEIGAACVEIQSNKGTRILIDAGLELEGEKATLPTDVSTIDAVFVSHAHPDHFGLVGGIQSSIPIYCGELTEMIIHTMNAFNSQFEKIERAFSHFKGGDTIKIKDDISVTPYITDHSVPDSYAFIIEADNKRILYSGDFRSTGRKPYSTTRILKNATNIDALIVEGTCIEGRESAIKSENEAQKMICETINQYPDLPAFAICSSINVDRIVSLYKACKKCGRVFVCDIYTALILWQMGKSGAKVPQMTWDDVKVLSRGDISQKHRAKLEKAKDNLDAQDFRALVYRDGISITVEKIAKAPNKYLIKTNQTEEIIKECHIKNANIIYSMWSGYMEERFDERQHYKKLMQNYQFKQIHTSGHAMRQDLFNFIDKLAPKKLIPFHTNAPEKFLEKYQEAIVNVNEIAI